MAGDEDKKVKKKKVKKSEKVAEEAPAPEPEPKQTPAPAEPQAPAEDPAQEVAPPAEGQEEGAVLGEDGEVMEAPPAPKKKPKFFIHWNRRKPKFYDYNFDYGTNYYSSVVNYIDHKNLGSIDDIPRRKAFAERGIDSSLIRKSQPDMVTQNLVNSARSSIRGYENFQREYGYDVDRKYFI